MATKKELLAKLQALGIDASPTATLAELENLIAKQVDVPVTPPERLKASTEEPERGQVTEEVEDYLRQYQYRKGTVPGSPESDPQPGSKAEVMKRKLLRQRRVRTIILRAMGEHKSIKSSVTLNGYRLDFPKNRYLDLPEQISQIIIDSQQQTEEAISQGQIANDSRKLEALS